MNYIQRIRSRASKVPKRIILSEGTDDRVILAAIEAIGEGFGEMTLLGSKDIITQKLLNFTSSLEKNEQNEIYSKINILDPENSDLIEEFAKAYLKCREKKIIKIDDALEIVKNDLGQIDNSEIELLKKYSESTNAIGSSEEVFI